MYFIFDNRLLKIICEIHTCKWIDIKWLGCLPTFCSQLSLTTHISVTGETDPTVKSISIIHKLLPPCSEPKISIIEKADHQQVSQSAVMKLIWKLQQIGKGLILINMFPIGRHTKVDIITGRQSFEPLILIGISLTQTRNPKRCELWTGLFLYLWWRGNIKNFYNLLVL